MAYTPGQHCCLRPQAGKAQTGKSKAGATASSTARPPPAATGVTAAQLEAQVLELRPELEGVGSAASGQGGGGAAHALAVLLLPRAAAAYEAALAAAFTMSAQEKRQAKDALAQALEAAYGRLCLYADGLEGFAPVPAAEQGVGDAKGGSRAGGAAGGKGSSTPAAQKVPPVLEPSGDSGVYAALTRHALRTAGDSPLWHGLEGTVVAGGFALCARPWRRSACPARQQVRAITHCRPPLTAGVRTAGAEAADLLCKWAYVEHDADSADGRAGHQGTGRMLELVKAPPFTQARGRHACWHALLHGHLHICSTALWLHHCCSAAPAEGAWRTCAARWFPCTPPSARHTHAAGTCPCGPQAERTALLKAIPQDAAAALAMAHEAVTSPAASARVRTHAGMHAGLTSRHRQPPRAAPRCALQFAR